MKNTHLKTTMSPASHIPPPNFLKGPSSKVRGEPKSNQAFLLRYTFQDSEIASKSNSSNSGRGRFAVRGSDKKEMLEKNP